MIKGKVINSSSKVQKETKEPVKIMPKKIISSVPKNEEAESVKKIVNAPKTFVRDNSSLYMDESVFRKNVPNYDALYYKELSMFLKRFDNKLTQHNIERNINKFQEFGDAIQRRIQNIGNILDFVPHNSLNNIRDKYNSGFFKMFKDLSEDFDNFNTELNDLYLNLSAAIKKLSKDKQGYFNNFEKLDFYYDCLKFIAKELVDMNIIDSDTLQRSVISSKLVSLHTSKTVIEQFKATYEHEQIVKKQELDVISNYLNTLKPSLELLRHNNSDEFNKQFKKFLNS